MDYTFHDGKDRIYGSSGRTTLDQVAFGAPNVYPAFTGFSVTSSHHAGKLYQANDQSDRQVFAVSDPLDAWVLEVQAAPQAGWKHPIVGVVIVDATTGRVKAASLFASN